MSNKKDFIKKDRFKSLEIAASRVSENISEVKDEIMETVVSRFAPKDEKLSEELQDSSVVEIDISKLSSAPEQWNFYQPLPDDKMLELVESIKDKGLMHPLVVWEQKNSYMILSGHNRKKAVEMLYEETKDSKYKAVKCNLIKMNEINEDEAREIIIDTNWIQRQLSTVEKAKSISEKYIRLGRKKHLGDGVKTRDIIAESYGISGRMVQNYLSLNQLIEEMESLLRENHITIKSAVAISRLSKDKQKWLYENFTSKQLSSPDIKNIEAKMTKTQIEKLLNAEDEYVNVNIKVPANKKAELLEKVNQWLKELN